MNNGMTMRNFALSLIGAVTLLGLSGCDSRSPTINRDFAELKICRADATGVCPDVNACLVDGQSNPFPIPLGTTREFCAYGFLEGLASVDDGISEPGQWLSLTEGVAWSVDSAGAGNVSVDQSGVVSALTGPSADGVAYGVVARLSDLAPVTTYVKTNDAELQQVDILLNGIKGVQPSVLVGANLEFVCQGSYSAAFCDPASDGGAQLCDVTGDASFSSNQASIVSVNNDGVATADAEGVAEVICSVDKTEPVVETLVSDPAAEITVCPLSSVSSVAINSSSNPLLLAEEGSAQIQVLATFADCRAGSSAVRTVDVTDQAVFTSSDEAVATADAGTLTAVGPGTTIVSATFAGQTSDELTVIVQDADLVRVEVTGPSLAIGGAEISLEYTAQAIFVDADGVELEPQVVTDGSDTIWSSSAPEAIAFADVNDGTAVLSATAGIQTVTITASYLGVVGTTTTDIVAAQVKGVEVIPDFVCVGDTLSMEPVYPLQLTAYAILEPLDADGNPIVDADGNNVQCSSDATNSATWEALPGPIPLLDLLGGLSSCGDAALPGDPTGLPVTVNDSGQVTDDPDYGPVEAGTACIQASLGEFSATSTLYVLSNFLNAVCEFQATTEPSVASCDTVLAAP